MFFFCFHEWNDGSCPQYFLWWKLGEIYPKHQYEFIFLSLSLSLAHFHSKINCAKSLNLLLHIILVHDSRCPWPVTTRVRTRKKLLSNNGLRCVCVCVCVWGEKYVSFFPSFFVLKTISSKLKISNTKNTTINVDLFSTYTVASEIVSS